MKLSKIFAMAIVISSMRFSTQASEITNWATKEYCELLPIKTVISEEYVEWEQFAPGNAGYSESIFIHPTDPETIFNFPDMHNTYRSIDGGTNWHTVLNSDWSARQQMSRVYGVDFSRQDENFGMCVNWQGVYTTRDKGATWEYYNQSIPGSYSAVTVDPNDDNVWYLGSGNFWDTKGNHQTLEYPHGKNNKNAGKLYKTIDGGQTWNLMYGTGIHSKAVFSEIYVSPTDPNLIIVATSYGLYKSTDGKTFKKITTIEEEDGVDRDLVRDLAVYVDLKTHETTLYTISQMRYEIIDGTIVSKGGPIKSTDFGETWISIIGDLGLDLKTLSESSADALKFIGGWFPGFFKKYFGTNLKYWDVVETLPDNFIHNMERIVVDPTDPNKIYLQQNAKHQASMFIGDVWSTSNGGENWSIATRVGTGWTTDSDYWSSIGQDSDINVDLNYVGSTYYNDIYDTQAARDLDIDSNGNVYVMFRNFVKSTDSGETWTQLDAFETSDGNWVGTGASNLPGGYIAYDPYFRDTNLMFLISGENGLFKRMDDADTVKPGSTSIKHITGSPESPAQVAFSPTDINTMYMTIYRQDHNGEFLKSIDGGNTWNAISRWYELQSSVYDGMYPKSLMVEPSDDRTIYFSNAAGITFEVSGPEQVGDTGGVYKSTDGGYTWERNIEGLPHSSSVVSLARKSATEFYAGVPAHELVTIKNSNFNGKNTISWTSVGDQDADNSIGVKQIKTNTGDFIKPQTVATIIGNGIGIEQTIENLIPNTKYYLSSIVKTQAGEKGTLYAKDLSGAVISELDFNSELGSKVKGVFFETGENETSITIGAGKKEGAGEIYLDNFMLRPAGGLYISKDATKTWEADETFPDVAQVNKIVINHGKIYVGSGGSFSGGDVSGLWVSEDNGSTWNKLFEMHFVMDIEIDPYNPDRIMVLVADENTIYQPINTGIYLSHDGGQTWDKVNKGLGNPSQVYDISFDPDPEKGYRLWGNSNGGGFYQGTVLNYVAPEVISEPDIPEVSSPTFSIKNVDKIIDNIDPGEIVTLSIIDVALPTDPEAQEIEISIFSDFMETESKIISIDDDAKGLSFEFEMPRKNVNVEEDFSFTALLKSEPDIAEVSNPEFSVPNEDHIIDSIDPGEVSDQTFSIKNVDKIIDNIDPGEIVTLSIIDVALPTDPEAQEIEISIFSDFMEA
ncbi:MAG: hypothetical protein ATN31_09480, partial [Candidatus Epulonipiscioides saccharophilum]